MLQRMNLFLEKAMPYVIPIIVFLGVTLWSGAQSWAPFVKWIFAFISFSSCLSLNLLQVKQAFSRPLPIIICLSILQFIIPLLAYVSGIVFFSENINMIAGLVLAFTIPTGVVTLMWVGLKGGNKGLTLAIVLVHTLLSPFLVPLTLQVLVGAQVSMDVFGLMSGLFWMIVFPSIIGIVVNRVTNGKSKKLGTTLAPFSKVAILVVILINSAVVSPYFQTIDGTLIFLFFLVWGIACVAYMIGLFLPFLFKWDKSTAISLMYNSGMRNTGVGASLAVTYFPPAAALPVVLSIVFQQFLAAIAGRFVTYYFDVERQEKKEDEMKKGRKLSS
ncbi:bile acid:sodium symporter family protein [Salibacterium salarium]|uniref:Bile acid:sodium symporter family protein n=1 Tax=Salibacterium salarium TaxID=284579 RepID=A0A3R9Q6M7_9BACI|nr:bile acid:sodium symporter family protein [Salibacterium salarium]RSL34778.1 bile acid:sodium symporter family protein [Salibacterium salarium]